MNILRLLFIVAIGLIAISCVTSPDDRAWWVSGIVYDIDSQIPLENVSCNIVGNRHEYGMMSDSLGYYFIAPFGDPPDSVIMYFTKEGYIRLDTVLFFEGGARSIGSVDIYLEPRQ